MKVTALIKKDAVQVYREKCINQGRPSNEIREEILQRHVGQWFEVDPEECDTKALVVKIDHKQRLKIHINEVERIEIYEGDLSELLRIINAVHDTYYTSLPSYKKLIK